MKYNIRKSSRNTGKFFHKSPDIKCIHTRSQAFKDITKCCEEEGFFTRNYVSIERTVLNTCECAMQILSIDTTIL